MILGFAHIGESFLLKFQSLRGGAENQAFDPSPEGQMHGEFHNLPPDFARRPDHSFEQNGFSSFDEDDDEDEDSVTPRATDEKSDYVLHEGRSTFYAEGDSPATVAQDAKDTISTSSTQKLDDMLEEEKEEEVFKDATEVDDNVKAN